MPPIDQHQSSGTTKALIIGDSSSGKSGALISLAEAGYNLRILDTDNGLDILKHYATDSKSPYRQRCPDIAKRIHFITVTDEMKNVGGKLMPKTAKAWQTSIGLLQSWKEIDPVSKAVLCDFGSILDWTEKEVLVMDTLSSISTAAMNFILSLNGRLGSNPQQSDWMEAQRLIEGLLQMLYDSHVKCNVIINCHITYQEDGTGGPARGYPFTLGKALPPRVGRYFNSALMVRSTGAKREIHTDTMGLVELKNTAPLNVQKKYDISDGLARYFADVRR